MASKFWIQLSANGQFTRPIEPRLLLKQFSPDSWQYKYLGLANTVKLVTKGFAASSAFLLVTRKFIDEGLPNFVSGSIGGDDLVITLKSEDGNFRQIVMEVKHAYSLTGMLKPDAEVDQTNFENQVYLLHAVKGAHVSSKADIHTRPYSITPYEGEVHRFNGLTAQWHGTDLHDDLFAGSTVTNADFPDKAAIENMSWSFQPEQNWQNAILTEIHHTVVRHYDTFNQYISIEPMGYDSGITSSERTANKHLLLSTSNDISNTDLGGSLIKVRFPTASRNYDLEAHTFHPADWSQRNVVHEEDVDVTTFTASELGTDSAITSSDVDTSVYGAYLAARLVLKADNSNSSDITAYAKKIALLYVKSLIHNNILLNETYSGFVDFSGTASLSSIVYRIDANGPTTTIRNVGARQVEDNLEVPNILSSALTDLSTKVSSVHSDLDVSLPFQYDIHRLVPIVLQEELSGGATADAKIQHGTATSSAISWTNQSVIKVYNSHPTESVANEARGFAYWNAQAQVWVWSISHLQPASEVTLGQVGPGAIAANGSAVNVGTSPNSAAVLLADISGGTISYSGGSVTAYNLTQETLVIGALVVMVKDAASGNYMVIHAPDLTDFG